MKIPNLNEQDYVEVRNIMFAKGLQPNLILNPEDMDVIGSAEQVAKFEEIAVPIIKNRLASTHKMEGFESGGTFYSGTSEDQHGLADIMVLFNSGISTSVTMHFENGATKNLTPENIVEFGTDFFNFRQQFFEVQS